MHISTRFRQLGVYVAVALATMVIFSCQPKIEIDDVFMGISFGDSKQDFYDKCWKLNKQKLIMQGTNNMSVMYEMPDGLGAEAVLNFWPSYHNDQIYEMPLTFEYKNWAPWNKDLQSDKLIHNVADLIEEWYDVSLKKKERPGEVIYYRYADPINIEIRMDNEQQVVATITNQKYKRD